MSTTTETTKKKKLVYRQDPDGVFRLKKVDDNGSMLSGKTSTTIEKKNRVDNYLNELIECSYKVVESDEEDTKTKQQPHSHPHPHPHPHSQPRDSSSIPPKAPKQKVFVASQKKPLKKNNKVAIPPIPTRRPSVSLLLSINTDDLSHEDQKRIKEAILLLKEREKKIEKRKQAKEEEEHKHKQERLKQEEERAEELKKLKELEKLLRKEKEKEELLLQELEKEKKKKKKKEKEKEKEKEAKIKVEVVKEEDDPIEIIEKAILTAQQVTEPKEETKEIIHEPQLPVSELPSLPNHHDQEDKQDAKPQAATSKIMARIRKSTKSFSEFHVPSFIWGFITPLLLMKYALPIIILGVMGLVAAGVVIGLLFHFDRLEILKGKNQPLDKLINFLDALKKDKAKKKELADKAKLEVVAKEEAAQIEDSKQEQEPSSSAESSSDSESELDSDRPESDSDEETEVEFISDGASSINTDYAEFLKQALPLHKHKSPISAPRSPKQIQPDPHVIKVAPFRFERRERNTSLPNLEASEKSSPPPKPSRTVPNSRRVSTGSVLPVRKLPSIPTQSDEDLPLINEVRLVDDLDDDPSPTSSVFEAPPTHNMLKRGLSTKSKHSLLRTRENYKQFLANVDGYD